MKQYLMIFSAIFFVTISGFSQGSIYVCMPGDSVIEIATSEIDSITIHPFIPIKLVDFDNMVEGVVEEDAVWDIEGNSYPAVLIGTQIWMTKNLRSTRYPDSTAIANVTSSAWASLDKNDDAYCWYDDDEATNAEKCGAYYTFAAVEKEVCPVGWHVPSLTEWTTLIDYAGGSSVAGSKLKALTMWAASSSGSEYDSYGFTALPCGYRSASTGKSSLITSYGQWWTATASGDDKGYRQRMSNTTNNVVSGTSYREYGLSVRCLRD